LGEIFQVVTHSLGALFGVKGAQEAGLHCFPVIFVILEHLQTVPPGQCFSLEDAGQFSPLSLVIPSGIFSSDLDSLNEPAARGGVLAVVGVEQGQVSGSYETVMCCQYILKIVLLCRHCLQFFLWASFLFWGNVAEDFSSKQAFSLDKRWFFLVTYFILLQKQPAIFSSNTVHSVSL
jgi:hypothetical protein